MNSLNRLADAAIYPNLTDGVLVDRGALGVLRFTGATRLDLIHRMSTQAVKDLHPGQGAATILTSDIGRIIDRLILAVADDAVIAVTGENNAEAIARYLMRFVFFMDDFHVQNLSANEASLGVYGAMAPACLRALGFADAVLDLPLHHWREMAGPNGIPLVCQATDPLGGAGYLLRCAAPDKPALWSALASAGLQPVSETVFDYLRLEAGQPRFGSELTADYIPLEANLWADVSFSKGCYIGQEIIARMESRGKLAKRLTHFRAEEPLTTGAEIVVEEKRVGTLTSTGFGPRGAFALGYVKTATLETNPSALAAGRVPLTIIPA